MRLKPALVVVHISGTPCCAVLLHCYATFTVAVVFFQDDRRRSKGPGTEIWQGDRSCALRTRT
ncbi:unnamed protein product [Ilex paraguariensis]|uniref:Secreted protein n=1 Tax=Ilex paraguariensis TaxID=185542 RepID=A0ABC8V1Q3_9AQUA